MLEFFIKKYLFSGIRQKDCLISLERFSMKEGKLLRLKNTITYTVHTRIPVMCIEAKLLCILLTLLVVVSPKYSVVMHAGRGERKKESRTRRLLLS